MLRADEWRPGVTIVLFADRLERIICFISYRRGYPTKWLLVTGVRLLCCNFVDIHISGGVRVLPYTVYAYWLVQNFCLRQGSYWQRFLLIIGEIFCDFGSIWSRKGRGTQWLGLLRREQIFVCCRYQNVDSENSGLPWRVMCIAQRVASG